MKSLLDLFATKHLSSLVGDRTLQQMKQSQPGLFLRASSRPDLTVIVKGNGNDGDIATGDVKNDEICSVNDALKLSGAYLMLLLYWWRVIVGLEVSSVHGFALCGPFCRNLKQRKRDWLGRPKNDAQYSVCLMRLSAPKYLGDIPHLTYFRATPSLNDDLSARYLCQFLTNRQIWGQKTATMLDDTWPAFFTAPANFASKLSSTNWKLEYNGTSALVFHCHGRLGVSEVMAMTNDKLRRDFSDWCEYLEEQEKKYGAKKPVFYVKIVTMATDLNSHDAYHITRLQKNARFLKDDDFLRTYPVPPINGYACYCLLMADRGARITTSMRWKYCELNRMFRDLWSRTIALSKGAAHHHGDIAKHNILFEADTIDGDRLVLIDWDEARHNPKSRVSEGDERLQLLHTQNAYEASLCFTQRYNYPFCIGT